MSGAGGRGALLGLLLAWVGCEGGAPPGRAGEAAVAAAPRPAGDAPAEAAAAPAEKAAARPRLIAAPTEGDVAALVRDERGREEGLLLVYVGATWCAPCQAFHDALVAGELDGPLAGVRFLEFDADRDAGRLQGADYVSRYIPLFSVPGPDGRASDRFVEGGIKGPGAVPHIMRRLEPLIAAARLRP